MGPARTLFRKKHPQPPSSSQLRHNNNTNNSKGGGNITTNKKTKNTINDQDEHDTSKRTLFLSTRATPQETKTALQEFTKHRPTTSTRKASLVPPAPNHKPTTPHSPRDVMEERQGALAKVVAKRKEEEEQCKGFETASTASTTAWSMLEAPTLHTQDDDNDQEEDMEQSTNTTTVNAPQSPFLSSPASHHSCSSDNISLADSSITTEVGFLTTHNSSPSLPPSTLSQVPTPQSPLRATHSSNSNTTTTTTLSNWQPRSLKDLVRRDLRSHNVDVLERALHQITLDCWDDAQARSLVARAGGIMAILAVLEDFEGEERIAVAACHALEKLSLDTDNELAVVELGGCDVLWHLATTSTSGRVQEAAWAALQNCTCQSTATAWDMQVWATDVLPRLQDYPTQLVHAAAVAANLCVANEAQCHAFGAAGGLVVMATAMQHHWANATVRADLAQSITRICESVSNEST